MSAMSSKRPWQIRIDCHLSEDLARCLGLSQLKNCPAGYAELTTGPLDQAGLHGLLAQLRDLNLTLLAVNQAAEEND